MRVKSLVATVVIALLSVIHAEARVASASALNAVAAFSQATRQPVDPAIVNEFVSGEKQALATLFQTTAFQTRLNDGLVSRRVILYCAGVDMGVLAIGNGAWPCVDGNGHFRARLEANSFGLQTGMTARAAVLVADVPASGQFTGNYEGYDLGLSLLVGAHYAEFNRVGSDEANTIYLFGAQAGLYAGTVYSYATLSE
jgi:hypothetical protein